MKAVQVYYQCKGTPAIVHADVEEIPCNEKSIFTSREFRCRHCGERWVEAINKTIWTIISVTSCIVNRRSDIPRKSNNKI